MKKHWLAALPLMLAACGSDSGAGAGPDGTMPTPPGSAPELSEAEFANAITSTETSDAALEGSWSEGSVSGNDALIFSDVEDNDQVAVFCVENGGERDMNAVTLRWYVDAEETGDSVDVFTSAGAKSFGVSGSPVDVSVSAADPFAAMLAAARGDIRLNSGAASLVVPAAEGLRDFINTCRPDFVVEAPESEEDEE